MYHVKTSDENLQLHPWGITCLVMEPEEKAAYPQRNDLLWKGILEEVFEDFLRYYLRFQQEAMNMKFENELNKITGRTTTMGIEELLLAQARHEGEMKGKSIGEAKMKEKEISFVQTLIKDTDFDNQKIAALAGVEETFVKSIRLIEMQQIHG